MNNEIAIRYWNLDQSFPVVDTESENRLWPLSSALSGKVCLWDCHEPTLTLVNQHPPKLLSNLDLLPKPQWLMTLPVESLDSPWWKSSFGAEVLQKACHAGRVVLRPTIWTRQSDALLRFFAKQGIVVRHEAACSHGSIFYWNTRVGMRDLFLSIPEIRDMVIDSLVCHDPAQVELTLRRFPNKDFVVKANFAMGGFGVRLFSGGTGFDPEDFFSNPASDADTKKHKGMRWAHFGEPYVVEFMMGDISSNISVTVDCRVMDEDNIDIVGQSRQLLKNFFYYNGIESLGNVISSEMSDRISHASSLIGQNLAIKGFRGFFNLDFVVTRDNHAYVTDLNVRRSAPLDAHQLINRLSKNLPFEPCFKYVEFVVFPYKNETDLISALESSHLLFDGKTGVIPCRIHGNAENEDILNGAVLFVEKDGQAISDLENALYR